MMDLWHYKKKSGEKTQRKKEVTALLYADFFFF